MVTADEMYRQGLSITEIAKRLDVKWELVNFELERLGVTKRNRKEVAEMAHLQRKYNQIYKDTIIAMQAPKV